MREAIKTLEQEPTTKNYIPLKKYIEILRDILVGFEQGYHIAPSQKRIDACKRIIKVLEQEPQTFKWCTDCKEYDQEKHCCPRWSKVIRNTVEEMKQEYIEREALDKLRAEIKRQEKWLMDAGYNAYNVDIAFNAIKLVVDKYKAETEEEDA